MSPEQRSELELTVASHSPSVSAELRERLLFESARELGRRQASRHSLGRLMTTAVASCSLTLLLSLVAMSGRALPDSGLVHEKLPDASLADNSTQGGSAVSNAAAYQSAPRSAHASVDATETGALELEQGILTPISGAARWELSLGGYAGMDLSTYSSDRAANTDEASASRSEATPLRVGTPIDRL